MTLMALDDAQPMGAQPPGAHPEGAPADAPARPYIRFSAEVARAVCLRIAAGETQGSICADPGMPSTFSLRRWARERPAFGRIFARARAMGGRDGAGTATTYDPVTAFEIAARVAEGESMTAICDDPAMPSARTIFNWRKARPEFEEELRVAREAQAERMSDLGWKMALAATPQTAYLTRVQLGQLRWSCAILGPRTHGRLKPTEPPGPPEVNSVTIRTFQTEVNPETGQVRGVALHFDPETGAVERQASGDWQDPKFPLVKHVDYITAKRFRLEHGMNVDNPGAWDMRPSAVDNPEV
jgi:hypothetical protein